MSVDLIMDVYVTRVRRAPIGNRWFSLATLRSSSRAEFERICRTLKLVYWREAVTAAELRSPDSPHYYICITPAQRDAALAAGAIEEDR